MATLQEVIGNRAIMDSVLRDQEARKHDALSPAEQRAAALHNARILHEITYTLQLARDGETAFKNDQELLQYIEALCWATDGSAQPAGPQIVVTARVMRASDQPE